MADSKGCVSTLGTAGSRCTAHHARWRQTEVLLLWPVGLKKKKAFAVSVIAYQVYSLASSSYKTCNVSGTVTANRGVTSFRALKSTVNHHSPADLHTGQTELLWGDHVFKTTPCSSRETIILGILLVAHWSVWYHFQQIIWTAKGLTPGSI